MSIMTYLILFLVAGYLFKVNPVLCVGLVGAIVFFKIHGFFGSRKSQARSNWSTASETALVALCIHLLDRSERRAFNPDERSPARKDDSLDGLFLE